MSRKLLLALLLVVSICNFAWAQKPSAQIKFDQITYNFGKFSESSPVKSCTFVFTNVGKAPLIINEAVASCGCTVPSYTKKPVAPGEKGQIKVTYNGKGRFPGHFKKSITVYTNGDPELSRIYIEGEMTEASEK